MTFADSIDVQQIIDRAHVSTMQKKSLALCVAFAATEGLASLILGFVIPAISTEWGTTPAGLTPVALAGQIAVAVGALFVAPLADRVGRRPFVLAGAAILAASTLAAAVAPDRLALGLALAIGGLAFGAVPAAVLAYGTEMAPTRFRGTLVGFIGTGMALSGVLCGVAAGIVIPTLGWRALFVFGGAVALVITLLAVKWFPETLQFQVLKGRRQQVIDGLAAIDPTVTVPADATLVVPREEQQRSFKVLFAEGRGWMTITFWVVYLCQFFTSLLMFNWLPSVLTGAGASVTTASFATAVFPFGAMLGGPVVGAMMDRVTRRFPLVALSFALGAAGIVATAYLVQFVAVLFVALLVAGFGVIGTGAALNSAVGSLYPAQVRSAALGWANGWGRVGAMVGLAVGGWLLTAGLSAQSIFLFSVAPVVVCIAGAMILSVAVRSVRPHEELPGSVLEASADRVGELSVR
ncbi:MFS transporter [Nocardia aurantia]|uniref:3-hydroxybenzoate transporter MhbT n=1 Tax=Nocardia aurantia TaxID=2585199 RepID=A0A7K0E1F7_9NOCA|nr:MFS transporter [Nocardia aurantia]MQY31835.1 3-hydroxybenzoate transporter MhbT [Nocardia aurantia]